ICLVPWMVTMVAMRAQADSDGSCRCCKSRCHVRVFCRFIYRRLAGFMLTFRPMHSDVTKWTPRDYADRSFGEVHEKLQNLARNTDAELRRFAGEVRALFEALNPSITGSGMFSNLFHFALFFSTLVRTCVVLAHFGQSVANGV